MCLQIAYGNVLPGNGDHYNLLSVRENDANVSGIHLVTWQITYSKYIEFTILHQDANENTFEKACVLARNMEEESDRHDVVMHPTRKALIT